MHELDDPAEDTVLRVERDDVVRVVLPQIAGTGHVWGVADHGSGLEVVSSVDVAGGTAPGAAGHHEVCLRALQAGVWPVRVVRGRPWEETVTEERRLSISVE